MSIIVGMLSLPADKWVRVGSGLGLLLLLVVQEKVCPWLVTPPSRPEPIAAAVTPCPSEADKPAEKRAKKRLPHVLPDAPAPRWPAAWTQATIRQTTGARDGVVNCGRPNPATSGSVSAALVGGDRWAWHRFLQPVQPVGLVPPPPGFRLPTDPAVRTCISRTGPPRS